MKETRDEKQWCRVQQERLLTTEVVQFLEEGNVGAIDIFVGKTRRFTNGRETRQLEYDLYPEMALAEMSRIGEVACDRWPVERVVLIHRTGIVRLEEASVIVGVSAAHRSAAFEACRYLIDTLKESAPIWKMEHFADGTREWVGPNFSHA